MNELLAADSFEELRARVAEDLDKPLVLGSIMFLIEKMWLERWMASNSEFMPIDNSPLMSNGELREGLESDVHYRLLSSSVWTSLRARCSGGPAIERPVISLGRSGETQVEVYPLSLALVDHRSVSNNLKIRVSKAATFQELLWKAAAILMVPPSKAFLLVDSEGNGEWTHFSPSAENRFKTLRDLDISPISRISVSIDHHFYQESFRNLREEEMKRLKEDVLVGLWDPSDAPLKSYRPREVIMQDADDDSDGDYIGSSISNKSGSSSYFMRSGSGSQGFGSNRTPGAVGLSNIGNTCFMNSALQCLSNSSPLSDYFLSESYLRDLNTTNPLGTGGSLANAFYDLLVKLWRSSNYSISPSNFYHAVCEFAPQFGGYRQHDSQELIAFLLDGLHEDLNRVRNKPYTPAVEDEGRPDHEVAAESWTRHLARNKSVIVDIFQGQLKSRVDCPTCGHVSVTFDPFMYLSLPLSVQTFDLEVTVIPKDPSKSTLSKFHICLPRDVKVADLAREVAKKSGILEAKLTFAIPKPAKIVERRRVLSTLPTQSLLAFESDADFGDETRILVSHRYRSSTHTSEWLPIGLPMCLSVPILSGPRDDKIRARDILLGVARRVYGEAKEDFYSDDFYVKYSLASSGHQLDDPDELLEFDSSPGPTFTVHWESRDRYEKFLPFDHRIEEDSRYKTRSSSSKLTLEDCLQSFVVPERLGKDNAWYCPKCKDFKEATKKLDIWKTPQILIVHLKRFLFDGYRREKINTDVDFPLENLDISEFVLSEEDKSRHRPVYSLFAVSEHSGGLSGGHYTAHAKNHEDNKWYSFNDSSVHVSTASACKGSGAYLLFYERVSTKGD